MHVQKDRKTAVSAAYTLNPSYYMALFYLVNLLKVI